MKFGDNLRRLLEDRGITQKKMAQDLNIAASTLGNYVRGLREPDFETFDRIAAYFNVSANYLLDYHCESGMSPIEEELLTVFRNLNAVQQRVFLEQGRALAKLNDRDTAKSSALTSSSIA